MRDYYTGISGTGGGDEHYSNIKRLVMISVNERYVTDEISDSYKFLHH
jgi:hypothetical protein